MFIGPCHITFGPQAVVGWIDDAELPSTPECHLPQVSSSTGLLAVAVRAEYPCLLLEYQLHEGWDFYLFVSLLNPKNLEECLVHSKGTIHIP